jgi:hypothetical protein
MAMRLTTVLIPLLMLAAPYGCTLLPRAAQPIIEPAAVMPSNVEPDAAQDLRYCQAMVRKAAPVSMQPRWLPPFGVPENGVVLGTVDAPHPVWPSQAAYRRKIERCLTARGYEVRGWQ